LAPAKYYDIPEKAKLIDVGTGAGFPSVPLKIYRNDVDITLLDSLAKRVDFLKRLTEKLGIDARFVHLRAEDGGRDDSMREHYDIATARAVAALPVLCEYCLPFVKIGGVFIAMKGPSEDIKEADNAVKLLGGQTENIIDYALDNGDRRIIVIIRKISHTPPKYPRNSAQISKRSL
ncbi:MAG: 16S rRNA (guanine(527)-N(7))-methyltransferase RsmG, partial [Oscillospiraceae bacterium]|nr:16S rRNA (guanine(527)-N(7))-methyltransferase RsmG [Oscillospiraceae bacterium]